MTDDEKQDILNRIAETYIEPREKALQAQGAAALGFGEVLISMLTGLVSGARGLPWEVGAMATGRPTGKEMAEKYGLEQSDGYGFMKAAESGYSPRTYEGKAAGQLLAPVAGWWDNVLRWGSGAVPSVFGWMPGDWPKVSHATEQTVYGYLNLINPWKGVRGLNNLRKGGLNRMMGADVYLTRRQRAGKTGLTVPWYRGGKKMQVGLMVPEAIISKFLNLNPKNAYLSEVFNIKPLIAKEFKRLEDVMAKETSGSKEWNRAYNEYLNEAAKVILNIKATDPKSPIIKNLEQSLEGHIFPTSFDGSYMDILNQPQILSDLTKSTLPTEMLDHIIPRLKAHTKEGVETLWFTKPLMPASGHGVRASAAGSRVENGLQVNPLKMVDRAWESIWTRNPDAVITKELLLKEMRDINARGDKNTAPLDIDLAERRIRETDNYISVGPHSSLTPDRLLAHMNHTRVFDKSTGQGVQWNTDWYRLGTGAEMIDKALEFGGNKIPVIIDITNMSIPKVVKAGDVDFNVVPVGQHLPKMKKGEKRHELIIDEINAMMNSADYGWMTKRGAETASYPLVRGGTLGAQIEEEERF
jgi:hypothetical protein